MRWADTDSDDSDDEFQTHGNAVSTSLMVDLDVSVCMVFFVCCSDWVMMPFSVDLSPSSILCARALSIMFWCPLLFCSYILIHAFSAFISWPYVVSSSYQTIHPVLYPTPTQPFSPSQYRYACAIYIIPRCCSVHVFFTTRIGIYLRGYSFCQSTNHKHTSYAQ